MRGGRTAASARALLILRRGHDLFYFHDEALAIAELDKTRARAIRTGSDLKAPAQHGSSSPSDSTISPSTSPPRHFTICSDDEIYPEPSPPANKVAVLQTPSSWERGESEAVGEELSCEKTAMEVAPTVVHEVPGKSFVDAASEKAFEFEKEEQPMSVASCIAGFENRNATTAMDQARGIAVQSPFHEQAAIRGARDTGQQPVADVPISSGGAAGQIARPPQREESGSEANSDDDIAARAGAVARARAFLAEESARALLSEESQTRPELPLHVCRMCSQVRPQSFFQAAQGTRKRKSPTCCVCLRHPPRGIGVDDLVRAGTCARASGDKESFVWLRQHCRPEAG